MSPPRYCRSRQCRASDKNHRLQQIKIEELITMLTDLIPEVNV